MRSESVDSLSSSRADEDQRSRDWQDPAPKREAVSPEDQARDLSARASLDKAHDPRHPASLVGLSPGNVDPLGLGIGPEHALPDGLKCL